MNVDCGESLKDLRAEAERGMQTILHASSHMPSGKQADFMQHIVDQTKEILAGAADDNDPVVPLTEEACKDVASRFVAEFEIPIGGKGYMMDDDPDMKKIADVSNTILRLTQVGIAALPHLEHSPLIAAMLDDEIKGVVERTNRICMRSSIEASSIHVGYARLTTNNLGLYTEEFQ